MAPSLRGWLLRVALVGAAAPQPVPLLELPASVARFVVLTQPRSGSTWFTKYSENLAMVPGVVTAGEALHPDGVAKFRARTGSRTDPRDGLGSYLRYLKEAFDELGAGAGWRGDAGRATAAGDGGPVRAVGFKIMYHQLPPTSPEDPAIAPGARGLLGNVSAAAVLDFCERNDILVVHLERVNQLERYISIRTIEDHGLGYHSLDGAPTECVAGRPSEPSEKKKPNSQFLSRFSGRESRASDPDKAPPVRVRLDPAAAFFFAKTQLKQAGAVARYVERSSVKSAYLEYERCVAGDADFAKVRALLGLGGIAVETTERHVVACRARVANWHEIATSSLLERTVWVRLCATRNAPIEMQDRGGSYGEFYRHAHRHSRTAPTAPLGEVNRDAVDTGFARAKARRAYRERHAKNRDAALFAQTHSADIDAVEALFG